jgi:hypothetical protein
MAALAFTIANPPRQQEMEIGTSNPARFPTPESLPGEAFHSQVRDLQMKVMQPGR